MFRQDKDVKQDTVPGVSSLLLISLLLLKT